jgi:hypothetical protein
MTMWSRPRTFTGERPAATAAPGGERGGTWAVVLAGGRGTRLQQFIRHISGSDRPKQFCRID